MITIIDYNAGNLKSVQNALDRLGAEYVVASDPRVVEKAEKVIFPGVGAAGAAMEALKECELVDVLRNLKVPMLGICLGMQLLSDLSEEDGAECLGVVSGKVRRFEGDVKVPQIGWNLVKFAGSCPLFKDIPDESRFYFVHSYAPPLSDETVGVSFYGQPFASVVQRDNFYGVQFHPEKSGEVGLKILQNFLNLEEECANLEFYSDSRVMEIIPAIDLMDGQCVRLKQGRFDQRTDYAMTPVQMARLFERMGYEWLHIIDLDGAREGVSRNLETVRAILENTDLQVQLGGGLRSLEDIERVLEFGVDRVLVGSMAVRAPAEMRMAIERFGPARVVPAMDVQNGEVRISGWKEGSGLGVDEFVRKMIDLGVTTILCTDISRDGMMQGPNVELYEDLAQKFPQIDWIAAGGVTLKDQDLPVQAGVVGKAFYEGSLLEKRIIPCLDVKDGRTVKGVNFKNLRDAGDPVELGRLYSEQGADELVFLDITATKEKRKTLVELVERVAREISIPFTVGGGINSVEDIRVVLEAGADKVSLNSAIVKNPELINAAAKRFGSQCVVAAIDAKKCDDGWCMSVKGGSEMVNIDAVTWAKEAESRGAGEILLTSMDRDGTKQGFDLELLRAVSSVVSIPVIASGGAGSEQDFVDLFEANVADAALAASVFHFGEISIPNLKS